MLFIFQALFVLFVLFAISSVVRKKKDGLLGPKGAIFWVLFWVLAAILVLLPDSTVVLANYLGIGRGADLVLYVSLAVIFYILFRLHVKIESISRDLTKVVRKDSLDN